MAADPPRTEEEQLSRAVLKLNTTMLGMMLGVLFALAIFIATNWLVIKGGPVNEAGEEIIGPHLQLLGQFFIGYRVTFLGSLIGAAWGFAVGTIIGSVLGWIYNKLVDLRS
jgi:hypothetical protein